MRVSVSFRKLSMAAMDRIADMMTRFSPPVSLVTFPKVSVYGNDWSPLVGALLESKNLSCASPLIENGKVLNVC